MSLSVSIRAAAGVHQVVTSEVQQLKATAVHEAGPPSAAADDRMRHGAQPCLLHRTLASLECNRLLFQGV